MIFLTKISLATGSIQTSLWLKLVLLWIWVVRASSICPGELLFWTVLLLFWYIWGPGWLQIHYVAKTNFQLLTSWFLVCFFTKHWLPVCVCTTMFLYPLVLLTSFLSGLTETSSLIFSISYLRAGNCYFLKNLRVYEWGKIPQMLHNCHQ